MTTSTNVKHSKAYTDWHTPAWLVERCRQVLGTIDFDPLSSHQANEVVKAERYCTVEDPEEWKLPQSWYGNVLVNPPTELVHEAWRVMHEQYCTGVACIWIAYSIEQLQTLQKYREVPPHRIAIPNKRIKFVPGDGRKADSPSHANAIMTLGLSLDQVSRFDELFGSDCWILEGAY